MNVLFVSIAFPPKQDAECLQAAKYYKYLVASGIDISIITSKVPTLNMPYDPSLEKYNKGYFQKLEYKIWENKYLNYFIRKVFPSALLVPDSKRKFVKNWIRVSKDLISKPDIIYTRSFPLSSALMGLKLKEYYRVPWIMHLSDPWADAPWSSKRPSIYKKNKKMERICFDRADKICFTTEKTLEYYSKIYSQHLSKFEIFPNVYDSEDMIFNEQPLSSNVLRIVYTGGIAGNRGPILIINVIEQLRKRGFDVDGNIELLLAGEIDRRNKAILMENNYPYIKYLGHKTYEDAKHLQRSAHLLLILEEPLEDVSKAMFFPSKILDYLLAQRKMFAITTPRSQVDNIFSNNGWNSFDYKQLDETADFIVDCFNNLHNPKYFIQNQLPIYFDAKQNAERLVNLMKNL